MIVRNNIPATKFNSFGITQNISNFIEIVDIEDYRHLPFGKGIQFSVLGGGSNVLFTEDIKEAVLLISNKGIEIKLDREKYVLIEFSAGELWHDAVLWSVENNYGGIENLSLIPGKCGAAPIQNIGAYGVELKDVLQAVDAINKRTGLSHTFHYSELDLGYRNSIFKNEWKDKYIITSITLRLTKLGHHVINSSYGSIKKELEKSGISEPTISDINKVVTHIRQTKLPSPSEIGNAGSFFKNPIIPINKFNLLKQKFTDIPSYATDDPNYIKVPAGWLIDRAGWKGKVIGNTGTYNNQALVLVNHGGATGKEIYNLSSDIINDIDNKYGIILEREVNVW